MARHPLRDAAEDVELLRHYLGQQEVLNRNLTSLVATMRSHINNLLYCGMARAEELKTAPNGLLSIWRRDFAVPFASVAVADISSGGLIVSTGTGGEQEGPGTLVVVANTFACVPLSGRQITVTMSNQGPEIRGIGQIFFIAIYTDVQPFAMGQLGPELQI